MAPSRDAVDRLEKVLLVLGIDAPPDVLQTHVTGPGLPFPHRVTWIIAEALSGGYLPVGKLR